MAALAAMLDDDLFKDAAPLPPKPPPRPRAARRAPVIADADDEVSGEHDRGDRGEGLCRSRALALTYVFPPVFLKELDFPSLVHSESSFGCPAQILNT